jgi:uncharacterized protein (TIGR02145 family)
MNKFKRMAITAGFALATVITLSCSSDDGGEIEFGTLTDKRDSKVYKTVVIGNQEWMAENLNYSDAGSCYNNSTSNCAEYGRLYNWAAAMGVSSNYNTRLLHVEDYEGNNIEPQTGICPDGGWHIPSDAEWKELITAVGGLSMSAAKLKAASSLWEDRGGGTDDYGFAALPGGEGYSGSSYSHIGELGVWWSATEDASNKAYGREMGIEAGYVARAAETKSYLLSVRCVREYQKGGGLPAGSVPSSVIPDAIREQFAIAMPIYSGTAPPDIAGKYMSNNTTLTGSNLSDDVIGKKYLDMYVAFIRGEDGSLQYREKQGNSTAGSENVKVEIVGSANNFTAYFVAEGVSEGISTRRSTVISGTLTSSGISDFHYAFIMLQKGPDPDELLVAVNTYRIFKDGDGMAERYNWN